MIAQLSGLPLWCSSCRPTVTLGAALALIEREAGSDALIVLQPTDTLPA